MNDKNIWISWEKQRRSIELATSLRCELFILEHQGSLRYIKNLISTYMIVRREKPSILFVQNPSMILACFASCILKHIFNIPVIVDRHSNFLLTYRKKITLFGIIFNFLSYLSIKCADITIVTNEELANVVDVLGGNPFVLPDKIPEFDKYKINKRKLNSKLTALVVSSYAEDEPIEEIFEAARLLENKDIFFYVSGNSKKCKKQLIDKLPSNIKLTGFLDDNEYTNMLFSVDFVIVLTTIEYTLLCGCYEAISAEKPLITTGTRVLKNLFSGAIFVNNSRNEIFSSCLLLSQDINKYKKISVENKKKLIEKWNESIAFFEKKISDFHKK